ncbi:unnamed protein product [Calypogeia fissa]
MVERGSPKELTGRTLGLVGLVFGWIVVLETLFRFPGRLLFGPRDWLDLSVGFHSPGPGSGRLELPGFLGSRPAPGSGVGAVLVVGAVLAGELGSEARAWGAGQ